MFINQLTATADVEDLTSENYFVIDGSGGSKKLPADTLLPKEDLISEIASNMTALQKSSDPHAGTLLQKVGDTIKELDGNSVVRTPSASMEPYSRTRNKTIPVVLNLGKESQEQGHLDATIFATSVKFTEESEDNTDRPFFKELYFVPGATIDTNDIYLDFVRRKGGSSGANYQISFKKSDGTPITSMNVVDENHEQTIVEVDNSNKSSKFYAVVDWNYLSQGSDMSPRHKVLPSSFDLKNSPMIMAYLTDDATKKEFSGTDEHVIVGNGNNWVEHLVAVSNPGTYRVYIDDAQFISTITTGVLKIQVDGAESTEATVSINGGKKTAKYYELYASSSILIRVKMTKDYQARMRIVRVDESKNFESCDSLIRKTAIGSHTEDLTICVDADDAPKMVSVDCNSDGENLIEITAFGNLDSVDVLQTSLSSGPFSFVLPAAGHAFSHYEIKLTSTTEHPLLLKSFRVSCSSVRSGNGGIEVHSHFGNELFAPENTMPAFDLAAKSGYGTIVCAIIPSSDGILYCYHHGHAVLNNGGSNFSLTIPQFMALDSATIDTYFVRGGASYYSNVRLCRFEELAKLAAKTGITLCWSAHKSGSDKAWTESSLSEIKRIVRKYGVNFGIKHNEYYSLRDEIVPALSDVASYICLYTLTGGESTLEEKLTQLIGINFSKAKWLGCRSNLPSQLTMDRAFANGVRVEYEEADFLDIKEINSLIDYGVTRYMIKTTPVLI